MGRLYFLIFWIPAVVSGVTLWIAVPSGLLRRPRTCLAWFAVALIAQLVSPKLSPPWAIALVLQAAPAVYLAIRIKLDL